ncbi:MAG: hypothetical protein H8E47_01550 [Anaerolineales bacterium]|nr:hypothetical protein [Anaerolineales bacterium]
MSILGKWPALLGRVILRGRLKPSCHSLAIGRHLEEAVRWILTAREHSCDGGIPACFDLLRRRWAPSYPETTGYTIPTLLACAACLRQPALRRMASDLADYLLDVRTPEGGVGHWKRRDGKQGSPIVFDTGQVIFGWLAAWRETDNHMYLQAAVDAADWLVGVQSENGAWIRYQHLGTVKVIDTRVAWALLKLGQVTSRPSYVAAAQRNLDWALGQQQPNGWLRHAAFQVGQDPFTHTMAYAAEGLLESGLLLDEPRYIAAAEKTARVLLQRQRPDGSLASTYNAAWQPTSRSSCLTGNCQMALLWLRFHSLSQDPSYLESARRAVAFVAATQDLRTSNANIRGAIAGSHPIYGHYERFKYPNWAAKFFIDALLALQEVNERLDS